MLKLLKKILPWTPNELEKYLNTHTLFRWSLRLLIKVEPATFFIKRCCYKFRKIHRKNTCARVSFLINLQAWSLQLYWKKLWLKCFLVNFAEFVRAPFLEHLWVTAFARKMTWVQSIPHSIKLGREKDKTWSVNMFYSWLNLYIQFSMPLVNLNSGLEAQLQLCKTSMMAEGLCE